MKYGIILCGTPGTIVLLATECALCAVGYLATTDFLAFVGVLRSLACAERLGTGHYILCIDIKMFSYT